MTGTRTSLIFLGATVALSLGCSGGDDDPGSDAGPSADSAPEADAMVQADCLTDDPVPAPGAFVSFLLPQNPEMPEGAKYASAGGFTEASKDLLLIGAYPGFGVFAEGPAAGTYELTGAEADLNTCGMCISLRVDLVNNVATKVYMAESGSVTVTAVEVEEGGAYAATTSGVVLREISSDAEGNQIDVAGGCAVDLSDVSFETIVMLPPA